MSFKVSIKKAPPFDRPWSQRKRELLGFIKESMVEMAKFYVRQHLASKFKEDAFSRYGFKPRTARYNRKKMDLVHAGLVPKRIGRSDRYYFIPGDMIDRDLIWTDEWREHLAKSSADSHRYRAVQGKPFRVVARITLPHKIDERYKGELNFKTEEEMEQSARFFRERILPRLRSYFQGGDT